LRKWEGLLLLRPRNQFFKDCLRPRIVEQLFPSLLRVYLCQDYFSNTTLLVFSKLRGLLNRLSQQIDHCIHLASMGQYPVEASNQFVVFFVSADPVPIHGITNQFADCPIVIRLHGLNTAMGSLD
jgi:hypothetical protein